MKKYLFLLILCACTALSRAQFVATMTGSTIVTSGWSYGSASNTHDSVLQLTRAAGNQTAYAVNGTAIDMNGYCKFTADFDFQIVRGSGTVADGITFFFLSNPPPTGVGGGGMGIRNNSDGLILILDTYDNDANGNNPLATLLGYNGSITGYTEGSSSGVLGSVLTSQSFISDGAWHHVTVTYNAGNVNVYFNYNTSPSISGYYPLNITGQFGFSATTGGSVSTQSIKRVVITADGCLVPVNNGPLCQADSLKLNAIGDSTGATYYWYGPNGFTSTLQNPVLPNVTYADSGVYYVVKTVAGVSDTGFTDVTINLNPVVTASSNAPVCYGGTISLAATLSATGATFAWSGPGTFTSALQNPTVASAAWSDSGVYTVIATLNGCKDTATTRVSMVRVPIPIATNSSPTCLGYAVTLMASDTVSTATFTWSGPGGFTSGTQNPYLPTTSIGSSGIYTVTAHIGSCTASDTTLVVLSPTPPVPIIGVTPPICSGSTLTLTATDTAGADYQWIGPNGFVSTAQNPVITSITTGATGLYTLVASFGGCAATPAYVYVLVDSTPAVPIASATTPLCSHVDSLVLTSSCATPGVLYNWTGPALFTAAAQDTVIDSVVTSQTGNYTITVTKGICSNYASVYVAINETPTTPVTGSTSPVCSGDLLTLTAFASPSTGTYHWVGPNGFTSLVQNPSIPLVSVLATGVYSVYEDSRGCLSPVSTVSVTVNSTPAIPRILTNSPVCQGDSLLLHATDDTAGVTFYWAAPAAFAASAADTFIAFVTPAAAGVYTLTANLGSCSASNVANVDITATPPVNPSSNGPVCTGDTLRLIATSNPGNSFSWIGPYSFTAFGSITTRYPAILEYAGVYTVTVTEPGGCHNEASINVDVHTTPLPPWVPWHTFCQYAYAPPLQAVNATNVLWFPTSAGGTGTPVAPIPSTSTPGVTFYFLNQVVDGCPSLIDSIQVVVYPKPVTSLTPRTTALCPHDTFSYHAVNDDPFTKYHWYPTLYLDDSLSPTPLVSPIANVTYSLVTTNNFGCADTEVASVHIYPAPVISLNITDSITLSLGGSYHIQPFTNCSSFSWYPAEGLSNASISDPTVTPEVETKYIVRATTDNGCMATDSVWVHLNDETLFGMPNAFTPGNGINNQFKLLADGIASLHYFRIFDRWGVLVFETKNISEGWDGNYKGTPQPLGVYVYEAEAVSALSGKVFHFKGNVTLIR